MTHFDIQEADMPYTITRISDVFLLMTIESDGVLNLPAISERSQRIIIHDFDISFAPDNKLTVTPNVAQNDLIGIEGETSLDMIRAGETLVIQSVWVAEDEEGLWEIVSDIERKGKGVDIASTNDVDIPLAGKFFDVTGTTQINRISDIGFYGGEDFFLQFDGVVTVKDNQAGAGDYASILLTGSGDYVSAAGGILHVIYDGSDFKAYPVFAE